MEPRRIMAVTAALYGTLVIASWAIAKLPPFAPAGIENSGAAPIEDRAAPSLIIESELGNAPQRPAMGNAAVANDNVATTAEAVTGTAADTTAVPEEPKPIVDTASPDVPQIPPHQSPPVQLATASTPDPGTAIPEEPKPIVDAASPAVPQMPPHESPRVQLATASTPDPGTAVPEEPKPIVDTASPDVSQMPPHESPRVQLATASTPDPGPDEIKEGVSSTELLEQCGIADSCIDRYLWALYQRTPKEDAIKVQERRKVTVRKKGKTVTVTRTFTRLVDENFAWKDPKAAEKAGMPMMDYVIGGMDPTFKLKLFNTLRAAQEAGLSPGITSAFRDDYRQSIASGLKAATDRSYHGGSFRGGYGHGLAADIVSVKGATRAERWTSTESFWKWIDAHGNEFGIGRPYLDRDPPHVAPIDGKEYASHRRGTGVRLAESAIKKRNRVAVRDAHNAAKTPQKRKLAALQRS